MASMIQAFQSSLDASPEPRRRKRRKTEADEKERHSINNPSQNGRVNRWRTVKEVNRWRTVKEQQIYSSKLYEALRRSRWTGTSSEAVAVATTNVVVGGREIRETANQVLAVSAKATTRWSRAILAMRVKARLKKHKKAKVSINRPSRKPETMKDIRKTSSSSPVEKKVKVLCGLIPGCQKLPFSNLLEETTDYIAALEMQVRAMTILTEILAGSPRI